MAYVSATMIHGAQPFAQQTNAEQNAAMDKLRTARCQEDFLEYGLATSQHANGIFADH